PPPRRPGKSSPAQEESDRPPASRPPSRAPDAGARRAEQPEGVSRREQTPKLESDGAYRRALVALQEGRLSVALADLERALEIDPRNEAARQTYVSLLLENKRTDEAIRQLRLSLGIDPRQPGLAMVLARLQLERGGPALDTLMKTLPYAGDSADYLAFLAGVLQREQRHGEAARYYRDALQLAPNNGVWWMGLGISLQADQHLPEAREAFQRARQSNGLTPELQAFIERRLEQLSR
ncbi:MAG: tetratricopeptide repeat protein, partial [Duganella sp.]